MVMVSANTAMSSFRILFSLFLGCFVGVMLREKSAALFCTEGSEMSVGAMEA
jgi:hypothetical protein